MNVRPCFDLSWWDNFKGSISNRVIRILVPFKPVSTFSIKWSKTMQTRDSAQILTLPRMVDKKLCPRSALKALQSLYSFNNHSPLFQLKSLAGWVLLTDSRVRKTLKHINLALGLNPSYFTFHSFRRSAATLAFNSHVPIQSIKRHGTWTSDCVWCYIQADQSSGEQLACALANVINA